MIFITAKKLSHLLIIFMVINGLTACGGGNAADESHKAAPVSAAALDNDTTESSVDTDEDNDGYTDQEEIAIGTDPKNAHSTPSSGNQPSSSGLKVAFERYNSFRAGAGLTALNYNSSLENASKSHKNHLGYIYDRYNILEGHYENYESPHYTGYDPSIRGRRAGYTGSTGEVICYRQNGDVIQGIDELMSAIYHRNGILAYYASDMGIGGFSDLYNFKAQVIDYGYTSDEVLERMENAAKVIIYPYAGEINVRRVFYEERPDPLPRTSESGNPISVTFNPYYVDKVEMLSFELFESDGTKVENVLLMDSNNDPNGFFNDTDFALFPLSVLKASHTYTVRIEYSADGKVDSKEWRFTTRSTKDAR